LIDTMKRGLREDWRGEMVVSIKSFDAAA